MTKSYYAIRGEYIDEDGLTNDILDFTADADYSEELLENHRALNDKVQEYDRIFKTFDYIE